MVNFNGRLHEDDDTFLNHKNRGLRYGDSLFESIRVVEGKIMFWEDHYLRLMASMRILRMEIPMTFTMEFLEKEILKTVTANNFTKKSRVRLSVFRNDGGYYLPLTNDISYVIEAEKLDSPFFMVYEAPYEVELYKDHYLNPDMLSTLKTNNKLISVLGSIFAQENGYDTCLLLNQGKQVVEALNGNIFMVIDNVIKTPPTQDGCLNGIIRKKVIEVVSSLDDYSMEIASISPFDLQKADELFTTNAIQGIRSITKYRKKSFSSTIAKDLLTKLNTAARLTSIS
ncbi:MAG: aminotransferase class IV [Flavobacteriaceae bacterium]